MFGEGGNQGGGGGQKGGKLLARIGRAATFRGTTAGEEQQGRGEEQNGEQQGRRRRGWLKHFGLSSKASKNKSEVVVEGKRAEGIGEVEEGRWGGVGEVVAAQGRGVQGGVQVQGGSRLMQLGQKLESSDDSGRESGYTRFLKPTIISSKERGQIKYPILTLDTCDITYPAMTVAGSLV